MTDGYCRVKTQHVNFLSRYIFDAKLRKKRCEALKANPSVKVGDSSKNNYVDLHWLEGRGVWNNSERDPAELYDANNKLVSSFKD